MKSQGSRVYSEPTLEPSISLVLLIKRLLLFAKCLHTPMFKIQSFTLTAHHKISRGRNKALIPYWDWFNFVFPGWDHVQVTGVTQGELKAEPGWQTMGLDSKIFPRPSQMFWPSRQLSFCRINLWLFLRGSSSLIVWSLFFFFSLWHKSSHTEIRSYCWIFLLCVCQGRGYGNMS